LHKSRDTRGTILLIGLTVTDTALTSTDHLICSKCLPSTRYHRLDLLPSAPLRAASNQQLKSVQRHTFRRSLFVTAARIGEPPSPCQATDGGAIAVYEGTIVYAALPLLNIACHVTSARYEGGPKNNRNLNVARKLEVVARCAARCRASTQYSVCRVASVYVECYCCCGFFSKCLLGGWAIFIMADNKEQRVCVKFCFLLGTVRNLTAAL
jgi:hypothetical protein